MLVIATSQAASTGSATLIDIGQPGFRFLPFVAGGHRSLPPPGGLAFGTELTMLNILTGRFKLSTHDARMFALASIMSAEPERRLDYAEIILECAAKKVRPALEELMETQFKSSFAERHREQGRAEVRTEEAASALFTVLTARGIAVLDQARALINACKDLDQLKRWTARAATATTIDEVFA
jgi:hypothetical protein